MPGERILDCGRQNALCLAYSPDGGSLAVGGSDGSIRVFTSERREPATFEGHVQGPDVGRGVLCLNYSDDGRRLASGGADESVRVWEVATGAAVATLEPNGRWVNSVQFAEGGRGILASCASVGGAVRLWDTATCRDRVVFRPENSPETMIDAFPTINAMASGPGDATLLVTCHGGLACWDYKTAEVRFAARGMGKLTLGLTADRKQVAAADSRGGIQVWDVPSGHPSGHFPDITHRSINSILFTPDGKQLVVGVGAGPHEEGVIQIWERANGRKVSQVGSHPKGGFRALALSPDGRTLAAAGADGTVILRDFEAMSRPS